MKRKGNSDKFRHRQVNLELSQKCSKILTDISEDVVAALHDEKEEKAVQRAEMELQKGLNMIEHEAEIYSRPARTWFQSARDKDEAKSKIYGFILVLYSRLM